MKVLIVSDTHRLNGTLQTVIEKEKPFDMLLHLGDSEGSEELIAAWCREQNDRCQVHMVAGNNDFFSALPREKEVRIGSYKAFLTHGHLYNVSVGTAALLDEAKDRGAQLAVYGHTHRPQLAKRDDVLILNPGSLSFPRQEGRRPSYLILELDGTGELHSRLQYL